MSKDVRAPAWEAHFWVAGAQDPWCSLEKESKDENGDGARKTG